MVYILLADGFEEVEALTPFDLMRRAKLNVRLVSAGKSREVRGSTCRLPVLCDLTIEEAVASGEKIDLLMLPGGMPGTTNCDVHPLTDKLIGQAISDGAVLAAICAAPMILGKRGLLRGKTATAFPSFRSYLEGATVPPDKGVCVDGKIITAAGMGMAFPFGIEILRALCGDTVAETIRVQVQG